MTQQSNDSSATTYFNAHTEGPGYLNSLIEVKPKRGQTFKPFWTASFCMLEGDTRNPDKIYVSMTIPAEKALDELLPYIQDINDDHIKVFTVLRFAKYRGLPFMYDSNSKTPGVLGLNYSGSLISVIFLKVGDNVIKSKSDDDQRPANNSGSSGANKENPKPKNQDPFVLPLSVKLSKTDPKFLDKKTRLSSDGYGWHSEKSTWLLREVVVADDDIHYENKVHLLENNGYQLHYDRLTWFMTFPQSSSNNNANQNQRRANSNRR